MTGAGVAAATTAGAALTVGITGADDIALRSGGRGNDDEGIVACAAVWLANAARSSTLGFVIAAGAGAAATGAMAGDGVNGLTVLTGLDAGRADATPAGALGTAAPVRRAE